MLLEGKVAESAVLGRKLIRSVDDATLARNMRHALSLGLPNIKRLPAHDLVLAVAAGGPSLAGTYGKLKHPGTNTRVVAVNGSHDWLIGKGVVPYACGLADPSPRLSELITPHRSVIYFVSSTCDPSVFEKLNGYQVRLWHAAGQFPAEQDVLNECCSDWMLVGGGSTVSLRWITLAYILGFRKFRLHGFDSCSRSGRRHAYGQDDGPQPEEIEYQGYSTTPQWLVQVTDFFALLARLSGPGSDRVQIKVYGDGLLQSEFKRFQKECGKLFN